MLHAVFSDIHSNMEALEVVLADAKKEGAGSYLCLGDIVGYGAEPKECLSRIKALNGIIIAGNHDYAACGKTSIEYFNEYAREAAEWTMMQLDQDEQTYLADLPLIYRTDQYCLVHGSLDEPEIWEYIVGSESAQRSFNVLREQILFIGHSHVPWIFVQDRNGTIESYRASELMLESNKKYIVNIGSVGQPRDLDPRASYCLFDDEAGHVRYRRLEYTIAKTQNKIRDAHLPEILALRLEMGR
ncbi:MAG: metallophosphoesterase family protein [Chlamydiota bacterium]|nr:metallophosphoesterase family protein [Chlamydiota bacterium]